LNQPTKDLIDVVSQIGITLFGATAIIMVARKNRWGFVIGLAAQPFWFATAIINKQWGVVALNFVYVGTWSYGVYEWFFRKPKESALAQKET
jgi:nicotinamide riboside transporter PnuC